MKKTTQSLASSVIGIGIGVLLCTVYRRRRERYQRRRHFQLEMESLRHDFESLRGDIERQLQHRSTAP